MVFKKDNMKSWVLAENSHSDHHEPKTQEGGDRKDFLEWSCQRLCQSSPEHGSSEVRLTHSPLTHPVTYSLLDMSPTSTVLGNSAWGHADLCFYHSVTPAQGQLQALHIMRPLSRKTTWQV